MPRTWNLDSWMVFFWNRNIGDFQVELGPRGALEGDFEPWLLSRPRASQQPFFIGPSVVVDTRLNEYFDSPRRRRLSMGTNRKAAYALRGWLNFLLSRGKSWDDVNARDVEAFADFKRYDPESSSHVQGNTWHGEIAQLKTFYRWAAVAHGVTDPIATSERVVRGTVVEVVDVDTHRNRQSDVKWLSPGAQARWRDIGILGVSLAGVEAKAWRSRCDERDLAYTEGLYRSGLRMGEWASLLVAELPRREDERWFYTLQLADACAKGGYGHRFWIDHIAINHVRNYLEGERRTAVRAAQRNEVYQEVPDRIIVERIVRGSASGPRLHMRFLDGRGSQRALGEIPPAVRQKLYLRTPDGLEPAALWLNENGLPRPKEAWFKTFRRINDRVRAAGITSMVCTQHMLRHSFALKWFIVGKLIHEGRIAHMSAEQAADFRAEFGSTWHLVQTMLGHRSTETTKNVYLEPFVAISVDVLLQHAVDDVSIARILDGALRGHPRVIGIEESST